MIGKELKNILKRKTKHEVFFYFYLLPVNIAWHLCCIYFRGGGVYSVEGTRNYINMYNIYK